MQTMTELLHEIDSKLERTERLVAVQALTAFSTFIYSLAELRRKDRLIQDAEDLDQFSIEILREVSKLKPDFGPVYAHSAYYFIDQHDDPDKLENALGLLEQARRSPYLEPDILTYSAKALHELRRYEEASKKAAIALKTNPNNFEAHQIRSFHQQLKRLEREPYYKKRGRPPQEAVSPSPRENER